LAVLVAALQVADEPVAVRIRLFFDHQPVVAHEIALVGWLRVADADRAQPPPWADPVGDRARQERLPVVAAGDERPQTPFRAHVVPVEVQPTPVLVDARPAHRVHDRERAILGAGDAIAHLDVVEVELLLAPRPRVFYHGPSLR